MKGRAALFSWMHENIHHCEWPEGGPSFKGHDHMECHMFGPYEIHHILSRAQGGQSMAENLVYLCRSHHRYWHDRMGSNFDTREWLSNGMNRSPEVWEELRSVE